MQKIIVFHQAANIVERSKLVPVMFLESFSQELSMSYDKHSISLDISVFEILAKGVSCECSANLSARSGRGGRGTWAAVGRTALARVLWSEANERDDRG